MNDQIKTWLADSHPLLKYRVMDDLYKSSNLSALRKEAFNDPVITGIIQELRNWPGPVLKRHNDAKHFIHKLSFLADMGFTIKDEYIKDITEKVLEHKSENGILQIMVNIPVNFGGTGKDQYSWMLCDAPLLFYCLYKMKINKKYLDKGLEYLFQLAIDNGYPCAVSPELGRFNGPGKRGTPCPYANLLMVKLFSLFPERHNDEKIKHAVEFLLKHWERKDKHYLFGIGTDFRKLKYPLIWYDILHAAEVLSHYTHIRNDKRFLEIIGTIKNKADSEGFYKPESVWMAWKNIDSGQKREPSKWITFNVYRILKRLQN
ncbi:MAG TPA: hypothetical protein DCP02_00130 [Actinobacteria bacterium]|nr:hypothetical protein [Actinomycetota bacterium]